MLLEHCPEHSCVARATLYCYISMITCVYVHDCKLYAYDDLPLLRSRCAPSLRPNVALQHIDRLSLCEVLICCSLASLSSPVSSETLSLMYCYSSLASVSSPVSSESLSLICCSLASLASTGSLHRRSLLRCSTAYLFPAA